MKIKQRFKIFSTAGYLLTSI